MSRCIKSWKSDLEMLRSDTRYLEVEQLKAQGQDESVEPREERLWQRVSKEIEEDEAELKEVENLLKENRHRLGTVFAASGSQAHGIQPQSTTDDVPQQRLSSTRDWTLIEPASPRYAPDNLQVEVPKGKIYLADKELEWLCPRLPTTDQSLFKTGSATGCTSGMYGNLKICNIVRRTVDSDDANVAVDVPTFEHVMLPRPGTRYWSDAGVVEDGDAGSLVFDVHGYVLGMAFGGNGGGDLAYFTATRDLVQDIKRVTGAGDVRLRWVEGNNEYWDDLCVLAQQSS